MYASTIWHTNEDGVLIDQIILGKGHFTFADRIIDEIKKTARPYLVIHFFLVHFIVKWDFWFYRLRTTLLQCIFT